MTLSSDEVDLLWKVFDSNRSEHPPPVHADVSDSIAGNDGHVEAQNNSRRHYNKPVVVVQ